MRPGNSTAIAGDSLFAALKAAHDNDVLLASPYLTRDIAGRIADLATISTGDWRLLTRLDAAAVAGGYLSVEGIQRLIDAGVRVADCARLHAKVYIVGDQFGLIGSANLTAAGLGTTAFKNLEFSVQIDASEIPPVFAQLLAWWKVATKVDTQRLSKLLDEAAALPKARKRAPTTSSANDPSEVDVEHLLADARDRTLWVKAQHGQPYLDGWRDDSWFSSSKKGKPSFNPGDLALIYSTGAHGIYAAVEIKDVARFDPNFVAGQSADPQVGVRWPWVNQTRPRLVPKQLAIVSPDRLGFTPQGLQGGHRRLTLSEFAAGVRALADTL